jgi:hypothetical protein
MTERYSSTDFVGSSALRDRRSKNHNPRAITKPRTPEMIWFSVSVETKTPIETIARPYRKIPR